MDFKKHALILAVIEKLHENGSWTGKTHVQKALFLLSATHPGRVPFQFVLYKHGPYSFDIVPELEEMKSYAAILSEPVPGYYGVVLSPGKMAPYLKGKAPLPPKTTEFLEKVCKFVGRRDVLELEKIATAAWIRARERIKTPEKVAQRLHQLKPHIPLEDAMRADEELNALGRLRSPRKPRVSRSKRSSSM